MTGSRKTLLLVGLGHLGGVLLELLAREDWVGRIVACSRDRQRGEARCNVARLGTRAQGLKPRIDFRSTDVEDTGRFAQMIDSVAPDLILGSATMQTWWLLDLLPEEQRHALVGAQFGPWLPFHLSLTKNLMEGVRTSAFEGPVLTAPFPDVVNSILGKIGLAPSSGIGNIDEIVTKVATIAADRLGVPMETIETTMVAHHALEAPAFAGDPDKAPPYFLRIRHNGSDVTEAIEGRSLLFEPYPLSTGPSTAFFTAGSTVRLIRALFNEEPTRLHAPGPNGLAGGYPILAGAGRIEPVPIDGLSIEEAISINERSHPFDGIQEIESDGTAVFLPESVDIMKAELGYDCPRLCPHDATERGRELAERFAEYARCHGVELNRLI